MTRRHRRRRSLGRTLAVEVGLRLLFAALMFGVVLPLILVWSQNFKLHITTPSHAPASTVTSASQRP